MFRHTTFCDLYNVSVNQVQLKISKMLVLLYSIFGGSIIILGTTVTNNLHEYLTSYLLVSLPVMHV
jgi:hypothetical protein